MMMDTAHARGAAAAAALAQASASSRATAGEVADDVAVRGKRFVDGFAKTALDATMRNVNDASERLRVTVLNAAIQSEASATSDLPTLERAVMAMRCVRTRRCGLDWIGLDCADRLVAERCYARAGHD